MPELVVRIRSHHFVVRQITPRGRGAVESFARKFIQYGLVRQPGGRYTREAVRVYAAANRSRTEYRFHINTLPDFRRHLTECSFVDSMVEFIVEDLYQPAPIALAVKEMWTVRDYQQPTIDYILEKNHNKSKFIALATGRGKSFVAMKSLSIINERFSLIVKPMYIEKWIKDLMKTYDHLTKDDFLIIQGASSFMQLQQLAVHGLLNAKIIIISNKTFQSYIKLYEEVGDDILTLGYACRPDELCALLQLGVRLIDEVHQDFHLNFKIDLYTHVPLAVSLSATLLSDDDFVNRMYEVAYPAVDRYKETAQKKYIAAKAVVYRFKNPQKIRTKDYGSKTYSHHVFEKSIMRNPETLRNYLKMIHKLLESSYFANRKPGQKALVYCASVELATKITEYLKTIYFNLDVRRYVQEDEYANLMEADISVSTLLSSGTAVDIPGLITVLMTTAVSSSQANVQALGRLRELADGTTPEFLYLVCEDIAKHMEYHERKRVLFVDRVATHRTVFVGEPV